MKFNYIGSFGVAAGLAFGLAAASAGATTVTITGVGFYPADYVTFEGAVTNGGPGPYTRLTGPIALNLNGSSDLTWVYCLDWDHTIPAFLGAQLPSDLTYAYGTLNNDSTGTLSNTGNALSPTVSGEIATLLYQGVPAAASGASGEQLLAYQAAIWDLEYNLTQNAGDASPSELALINSDIAYAVAHPSSSRALTLYSTDGATQGLGTVPEPAAWSLMLLGFGGLGAALRSRRKAVAA